jgi:bacillithiol biosynthesis cysteine-adding enzyme BshC
MERARLVPLPGAGAEALGRALRRGEPAAQGLLPALPPDDAAWTTAIDVCRARRAPLPVAAVAALAAHQEELGAGPRARANALRLERAVAVVTGQQPGLLGGPLLTFHKAAGAIHLARRLEARTGREVVPVFWLASEDHDVEEANQLTLLDKEGQPRLLELPERGDGRSLVDFVVPPESSAALEARLRALLPDTPRAREAATRLGRREGESFSTWSVRCLLDVFGDAGLVVVEPRRIAPWLGPSLELLVRRGAEIVAAVRASVPRLRAAGLPAPLDPRPDDLPLFVRDEPGGPRHRLGRAGEGGLTRDGRPLAASVEDLLARLAREPAAGSPDVIGRVFAQNALLPVLAYVAGPTELAYLAQVSAACREIGTTLPLALPRPSAVWADARAEETAAAFGRGLVEVLGGAGPQREAGHPAVEAFLVEVRETLEQRRRRAALLVEGGARGAQALRAAVERLLASWDRSCSAVHAAYDADDGLAAGRWTRLTNLLFPRGRPQERTLSMLTLLARYGLDAVRESLAALDPLADGVWLLRPDLPEAR